MGIISIDDFDIDPGQLNGKVLNERATRRRFLLKARLLGIEKDLILLFEKFDKMLHNCHNDQERSDIAKLACVEVYRLLDLHGGLTVDGQLVL